MGERIRIRETKRGRALQIDGTFASWWPRVGEKYK
jgi:muconolactone delta-isomerase